MGIFRATKHNSLFKLSAAVFLLSATLAGVTLSLGHASAATVPTPKTPLTWTDSSHTSIADGSKNVYSKAGYSCLNLSNGVYTLLSSLSPTTIDCYHVVSDSSSSVYMWETSSTPKYALVIIPYVDGSGILADPGTCIPDLNSCKASVWTVNGNKLTGTSSSTNSPILSNVVIGGSATATPVQTPTSSNGSVSPTCESGGFSLSWIMCPVINMLSSAVDNIYSSIIQPLLMTKPISLDSNQYMYKIWSSFRVYGDIFLVIALLVVVFGQSIGGGLIDAYSAKKILPRLLLAAILINLSIYIVALAVDVTNIVSSGIQSLLSQPFKNASQYTLTLNGGASATLGIGAALAGGVGTAGVWAIAAGGAAFLFPLLQFLLVFILMPAFFAFLALLAVIIVRQGLIILLVAIAPIAFALYCLPNTEQYFKKWWDLLFRTLLVYPIIAIIFSIANILSVTISEASKSQPGILASLSQLMSVIALIVPLFLVAFAFRIAGGVLSKFHDVATGLHKKSQETIKGHANDPNSLRNRTKTNFGGAVTRREAQAYKQIRTSGRIPRIAGSFMGKSIEKESLLNQASKQRMGTGTGNGADEIIKARSSFIDTDHQRKTLDGKPVADADWVAAQKLYPNLADIQAAADYSGGKILSAEDATTFTRNFGMMAKQQGLTPQEATGAYQATAFAKQYERGEWKHGKFENDAVTGALTFKPVGTEGAKNDEFLDEAYFKRGSYEGSKMFSSYFNSMADIKSGHLASVSTLGSLGVRTSAEQAQYDRARGKLKQIREIEQAFDAGSGIRRDEEGNPVTIAGVTGGGLQGASAATKAAFERLKQIGGNNAKPIIDDLDNEIRKGDTYENYVSGNRTYQEVDSSGNNPSSNVPPPIT